MSTAETPLKPFELDVRERAAALGRRARWNEIRRGLEDERKRVEERSAAVRSRLRRATLEWGAIAHSSATLAGVRRDADKVGSAMRKAAAAESSAVAGFAHDLGRLSARLKQSSKNAKAFLLRSATVSGLAIDSKRVARRMREARQSRRTRQTHL